MIKSTAKITVLITQFLKIFLLESVFSACGNVNWPGHIQPCLLQSNIEFVIFQSPSPVFIAHTIDEFKVLSTKEEKLFLFSQKINKPEKERHTMEQKNPRKNLRVSFVLVYTCKYSLQTANYIS